MTTLVCPMYEIPPGSGHWYALHAPGCCRPRPYEAKPGTVFHCNCMTGEGCVEIPGVAWPFYCHPSLETEGFQETPKEFKSSPGAMILNPALNTKVEWIRFAKDPAGTAERKEYFARVFWMRISPQDFDPERASEDLRSKPEMERGIGHHVREVTTELDRDVRNGDVLTAGRRGHCVTVFIRITENDWRPYLIVLQHGEG